MADTIFYYSDNTTSATSSSILNFYSWNRTKTLIKVDIGDNVTEIGYRTFWLAFYLTIVNFSNSNNLKIIGQDSFGYCLGLSNIAIPNSVTTINLGAFQESKNILSISIGNSLTSVGYHAFYGVTNVTSLTFSEGLTSIGNWFLTKNVEPGNREFYGFPLVTNITIPNSVTNIGYAAFQDFPITNIVIPNNVTSIGTSAFGNCLIPNVYIPANVSYIGNGTFNSCGSINVSSSNLTYASSEGVLFDKNFTTLIFCPRSKSGSYTVPYGVVNINNNAFSSCQLTNINLPNTIKSIEGAFKGCNLKNINLPDSLEYVGIETFFSCPNLSEVVIGKNIKGLGEACFAVCTNLTNVYFLGNAPLDNGDDVFGASNPNLKIYRKKNFVTDWESFFLGVPVVLWSDNVIKSGGTGKLTTKKRN